jgi:uncharacterized RDD family membrane protein YckC
MSDPTPPPGDDQYPPAGGYPPAQPSDPSGAPPPAGPPPAGYPPPQGYPPAQPQSGYPPAQPQSGYPPPADQGPYQQPYGQPGYPPPAYGAPGQPGVGGPNPYVTLLNGNTVKVADFGQRAFGRIIDAVIVFVVFGILYAIVVGVFIGTTDTTFNETTGEFETTGLGGFGLVIVSTLLLLVAQILYEVAFVAVKGQTPGKMIIGTKVVQEQTGELIGWGPAFLRWLIVALGGFVCSIIGQIFVYCTVLFDKTGRMQGWHDKTAHDLVITLK